MTNKTILIGLDGGTFSIFKPLMEAGVMPFLQQFIASGTSGILSSVIPPITPPGWTSIATGRSPSNHGILDFFQLRDSDSKYLRYNNSRDIICETIWSIVSRNGLRITSLNFPMMTPPHPISGYVVPGWVTWRHLRRGCYPDELYDRLKELPFFSPKELAIDLNMERAAIEGCSEEEYEDWIKQHIRREEQWFEISRYLMTEEPCDLTAIVFDGVDKLQHLFWKFLHPDYFPKAPSPWEQNIRNLCLEYFSQLDRFIAEIVNLAGPDARIFMASDHGFTASMEIFYLNAWLHQNGYLEWVENPKVNPIANRLGIDEALAYYELLDMSKTTAYSIAPSNNGIYISVMGQKGEEGIPPENYENYRKELVDRLLQFTDSSGESVINNILTREEAYPGSRIDIAPDLTLVLRDSGFISTVKSDVLLKPRSEPMGTHHPEGIFIAGGSGICKDASIEALSILDVTPILLYSLGLSIPEDLEGHVPVKLFDSDFIQEHPFRIGEPTIRPEEFPNRPESEQSKDDQEKILRRLKALGYVE